MTKLLRLPLFLLQPLSATPEDAATIPNGFWQKCSHPKTYYFAHSAIIGSSPVAALTLTARSKRPSGLSFMTTMKVRLYPYEPIGICEVAGSADTKPVTPASITSTRLFQSPAGLLGSADLLRNTWHMRLQGRVLGWRQ